MNAEKVICEKSDLVNIANSVRTKLGVTDSYYLSQLSDAVDSISTGVQLPTLTNPGTASDLLVGKELIDQDGNVVTGTIPTKTSSDLTSSGAAVTVPSGYYASPASKSVSTTTQATPSISVNSSGLITASATQGAGYVLSGTKSATKQLTTKSMATITPGTADQTISSGTYLTGVQTIKGDSNLTADNIKSGTSIFGIIGSYVGSLPNLQSKSVTYTSNGTATITPDAGYDGLSSVDVTVNVSGGGGGAEDTVTVTLPIGPKKLNYDMEVTATYTNALGEIVANVPAGKPASYTVKKGSIFFIYGYLGNLDSISSPSLYGQAGAYSTDPRFISNDKTGVFFVCDSDVTVVYNKI